MADTDLRDEATARILCDPDNYDWPNRDAEQAEPSLLPENRPLVDSADVNSSHSSSASSQAAPMSPRPFDNGRDSFTETFNETEMRLSNHFIPVIEQNADTLIYVGAPPQLKDQTDFDYEYVKREFQHPYLMSSTTLRELKSLKFDEFLGPRSKRVQRKLQKAGVHKSIPQIDSIKYYIDLTPDIHDDEGMILLTALSAPPGVRAWHQDAQRFKVDPSHVCGRDSLDPPAKPKHLAASPQGPQAKAANQSRRTSAGRDQNGHEFSGQQILREHFNTFPQRSTQAPGIVPQRSDETQLSAQARVVHNDPKDIAQYNTPHEDDYSQLRHHMGIKRLLHAIAGNDPKLNSAPKAWTFCMLAKFFDCIKKPTVSRWITEWLIQSSNLNFIQVNPATAYRMGMALEAIWLVRSSFCIMVGQKAFANTACDLTMPASVKAEPSNLITDGLDDDEINRVDHAASALAKRVKDKLHRLLTKTGDWKDYRRPWSQVEKLYDLASGNPETHSALVNIAKRNLDDYLRRLMCTAFIEYSYNEAKFSDLTNVIGLSKYNQVPPRLRPLTLQFWEFLKQETFIKDHDSTSSRSEFNNRRHWERALNELVDEGVLTAENAGISFVSKTSLQAAIEYVNEIFFEQPPELVSVSPRKKVKFSPPSKDIQSFKLENEQDSYGGRERRVHAELQSVSRLDTPVDSMEENSPLIRKRFREAGYEVVSEEIVHDDTGYDGDGWSDSTAEVEYDLKTKKPVRPAPVQPLPIRSKLTSALSFQNVVPDSQSAFSDSTSSEHDRVSVDEVQVQPIRYGNPEESLPPGSASAYNPQAGNPLGSLPAGHGIGVEPKPANIDAIEPNTFQRLLQGVSQRLRLGSPSAPTEMPPFPSPPSHPPVQYREDPVQPAVFDIPTRPRPFHESPIYIDVLLMEIHNCVVEAISPFLQPGFVTDGSCAYEIPLNEVTTLTCLTDEEYKYLPLWAGGNDDGTGGVFDDGDEIPEAPEVEHGGFRGGAMGIIPGVGSSLGGSQAGSEFEEILTEVGVSTVGKASRLATDGTETVMSLDE